MRSESSILNTSPATPSPANQLYHTAVLDASVCVLRRLTLKLAHCECSSNSSVAAAMATPRQLEAVIVIQRIFRGFLDRKAASHARSQHETLRRPFSGAQALLRRAARVQQSLIVRICSGLELLSMNLYQWLLP